jgi:hypothetical protein
MEYKPAGPVTLDAPESEDGGDAAAVALASASAAATPAAVAPAPAAAPSLNPDVAAELSAMMSASGREVEVWHDAKPRRAKLNVSSDRSVISCTFLDAPPGKIDLRAKDIRGMLLNIPANYKKKMLGRNAKPTCSIALEDNTGNAVLHIETAADQHRPLLATALSSVVSVVARMN